MFGARMRGIIAEASLGGEGQKGGCLTSNHLTS